MSKCSKNVYIFLDSPPANITTANINSQLEIPLQERLLPIGSHGKDINQLVDKVKHALGLNNLPPKLNDKSENEPTWKDSVIGSPSPRRLIKQVALESPPNQPDEDNNTIVCRNVNVDNKSKF